MSSKAGVEQHPSWYSSWSFGWMNSVVRKARSSTGVTMDDLYFPNANRTEMLTDDFNHSWNEELQRQKSGANSDKDKPNLLRALWKVWGRAYLLAGMFKLMWSAFVITGAFFFVRSLLLYVDPKEKGHAFVKEWSGWMLTGFFFLDAYLLGLALQRMGWGCMNTGVKVRAAITDAVCSKAFIMESVTKETITDVVTFVASDINKVYEGMQEFHYLWTAPLEAFTILALLASLTKQFAAPGVGVMMIVLPLQYYFGYLIAKNKYTNYKNIQARGVIVQEVLPAMKLVKYYVWEKFFEDKIMNIRMIEQKIAFRTAVIKTINVAMVFAVPPTTAYVIFTAYEFGEKRLVAAIAFTTLSLFNILRFPLVVLPKALRAASEGLTSLRRIEEFLCTPVEVQEKDVGTPGISIVDSHFQYTAHHAGEDPFQLHVPKFEVKPGEVVAVVGRVGAGKSSLIQAILGNMHATRGHAYTGGRVAYVPQVAWIQNLSLKDNILFGAPYDHNKYQQIIHDCALETDLEILPLGDQTFGGLRGVNLSGGQRQRLNLARAGYFDGDTILLDNALSAVDHHTAEHIFDNLIKGTFHDKCVVLVTHQLQFLGRCDKVAIMDDGKMLYFGPWNSSAHGILSKYLPVNDHTESEHKQETRVASKPQRTNAASTTIKAVLPNTKNSMSQGFSIYAREAGVILGLFMLFFFLAAQISRQMSDYWIRQWVADSVKLYKNKTEHGGHASIVYTQIYLALVGAFIIFMAFRGSTFFWWTVGCSNRMFKGMLTRVLNTPLGFFLVKPVGDLLINFSSDQDQMDENLPDALHYAGIYGLILLSTAVTVSVAIHLFSCFAVALLVVTATMLYLYLPASTVLKKMRSDSQGALVGLVAETLEGLSVIQAYRKQPHFVGEAQRRTDTFHKALFSAESLNLWLAFHCDFFGAVLVLAVCCFAVAMKDELGSAVVGLAFSNTIQMLVFYTWSLRLCTEAISLMSAVEKISWLFKFTPIDGKDDVNNDNTKLITSVKNVKELALVKVDNSDKSWPTRGEVIFENVKMKYRPGANFALDGVSFHFRGGDKIGVVGRTGSGKSTTLLALYRMFDLAAGRIIIDGVDTSTLPLQRLRRGLSIVPQEPVMFSGTVRENLDPYNEHPDGELWSVLREVGLEGQAQHAGGLEGQVDGSGSGQWSLGQMQLVCLARAALTKVPILCCDEATAAMDPHTEKIILEIIDRLFCKHTIITIAHRLDAVITADQVLVMEKGRKQEMAPPSTLLADPSSFFSKLVDRSGAAEAAALRRQAAEYEAGKRAGHVRGDASTVRDA